MKISAPPALSRRERQIMDIVYRRGTATAADVQADLPDQPSYSAVRAVLRVLEEKGRLEHGNEGKRYVYRPTTSPDEARASALRHMLTTFFGGSPEKVVNTLLEDVRPSATELGRLAELIEKARREENEGGR
jgi:BlaI family transcriptional regulator, penicillinase repressor